MLEFQQQIAADRCKFIYKIIVPIGVFKTDAGGGQAFLVNQLSGEGLVY